MVNSNPWIEFYQPKPNSRLILYCLPYAGGGAQIFMKWNNFLPEQVEVCPIQLPGRWTRYREQPFKKITDLVNALIEKLPVHTNKQFALFGHSLGAIIAFEFCRKLRKIKGPKPVKLFIAGRSAPQIPLKHEPISKLPNHEFIDKINTYYNGIPDELLHNYELLELLLPVMRADMEMDETYSYLSEPPLDFPFSAFGGLQDPNELQEDLEAWKEHTTSSFTLHMIEGKHFFIHTAEQIFLQKLSNELNKITSDK